MKIETALILQVARAPASKPAELMRRSHYTNLLSELVISKLSDDLRDHRSRGGPYRGSSLSSRYAGYCYVACEAIYHLLGGSGWKPHQLKHEGVSHWYLRHEDTGEILDPTQLQFEKAPDYSMGRKRAFLTVMPSKRAQTLIRRVWGGN